jgi:hypothetical protein
MLRSKKLLIVPIMVAAFLFKGCQNEPSPIEPIQSQNYQQTGFSKIEIPVGATIDSAMVFFNVTSASDKEVTLHRITNSWDEMMVTWNNFGGSFDATVENSFTPSGMGWYSVDVTGLVNSWIDSTYQNYGILLKETSPDTFQTFSSKEGSDSPFLKVWYTLNGSSEYDSTDVFADSYIQSDSGDVNFGNSMELVTGWQDTVEAQTLVSFEIEMVMVYTGCTRGQGYWKTHSFYGPAPYDSTWALLGEDSTFFLSNQTNHDVMWTPPSGGNAYYMLAHQYIATVLNILSGADPSEIQATLDDATDMFETYTPEDIGNLRGNNQIRQEFISLKNMLARYNDGEIGPGSCSENGGMWTSPKKYTK